MVNSGEQEAIRNAKKAWWLLAFLNIDKHVWQLSKDIGSQFSPSIGNLGTLDYKIADSKEIIASYER